MRLFISYSSADKDAALSLCERLNAEADFAITHEPADAQFGKRRFGSPRTLAMSVRDHDAVAHLISLSFLKSYACMRQIVPLIKDDTQRNLYLKRTVPIILEDSTTDLDLFDTDGRMRLVDYWMTQKTDLEQKIKERGTEYTNALEPFRDDLTVLLDIAEQIARFMRTVTDNSYAVSFTAVQNESFADILESLHEIAEESQRHAASSRRFLVRRTHTAQGTNAATSILTMPERGIPDRVRLEEIRDGIVIASENDPKRPEFPSMAPRFPATVTTPVNIPELKGSILIKDESQNPTGSHKDRMAWEIVVYYKSLIEDLLEPSAKTPSLPSASIISNGSAAIAIQVMLRSFDLPSLKVLVDEGTDTETKHKLSRVGCHVYEENLAAAELDSMSVLKMTDNLDGFDLTARNLVDPLRRKYYDWLAYEVLNSNSNHIFVPVGTGDLFVNILTVLHDEVTGVTNDERLYVDRKTLAGTNVYGATSNYAGTSMDKLYAAYRPTLNEARRVVSDMRDRGICGARSDIYTVREDTVPQALAIARENTINSEASGIAGLSLLLERGPDLGVNTIDSILVVNTGWLPLP